MSKLNEYRRLESVFPTETSPGGKTESGPDFKYEREFFRVEPSYYLMINRRLIPLVKRLGHSSDLQKFPYFSLRITNSISGKMETYYLPQNYKVPNSVKIEGVHRVHNLGDSNN